MSQSAPSRYHPLIVGIGNLRTLMTRPEKPMYNGLGTWVLPFNGSA